MVVLTVGGWSGQKLYVVNAEKLKTTLPDTLNLRSQRGCSVRNTDVLMHHL